MNNDQRTRLEIMRALGEDFPDRVLEDLIEVARYVEVGAVERARLEEFAEKFFETLRHLTPTTPALDETEPRVWERWEDVPEMVVVKVDTGIHTRNYRKNGQAVQTQVWGDSCYLHTEMNQYASFTEVRND